MPGLAPCAASRYPWRRGLRGKHHAVTVTVRERTDTKIPRLQVDIWAMPPGQLKPTRFRYTAPRSITSKSGAQRWGESVRRDIEAGKPPPKSKEGRATVAAVAEPPLAPEVLTLRQAAGIYLDDCAGRGNVPGTIAMKGDRIKRILATLGEAPLATVGEAEGSRLRAALRGAGLIASTANGIMSTLQAILDRCHALGYRPTPAPRLGLVRERRAKTARAYDDGVFELLVAHATAAGPEYLAIVLVCGDAGLRVGELRGLEVRDIDLARSVLHVERSVGYGDEVGPTKNGEARVVPMSPRLAEALRALTLGRHRGEPVFITDEGDRLSRSTVRARLSRLQKAAGLPEKGVHVLRHSCATSALAGGADVVAVQKMLGHRSLSTTVGAYLHDTGEAPQRAIAALTAARAQVTPGVTDLSRIPCSSRKPRARDRKS